jgi:hypothetical protein
MKQYEIALSEIMYELAEKKPFKPSRPGFAERTTRAGNTAMGTAVGIGAGAMLGNVLTGGAILAAGTLKRYKPVGSFFKNIESVKRAAQDTVSANLGNSLTSGAVLAGIIGGGVVGGRQGYDVGRAQGNLLQGQIARDRAIDDARRKAGRK